MSGTATAPKLLETPHAEVVMMSPKMATELLKRNHSNRRFRDYHAGRIARLISGGRWKFNGDTVKLDFDGYLQDGQHRLTAIIEAGVSCPLVVVWGVQREAFATIDTMRMPRSYADVIELESRAAGFDSMKYSSYLGGALAWLCRYDRKIFSVRNLPENKIENDEIEVKFRENPGIAEAVARTQVIKSLCSPALAAFFYYLLIREGQKDLAERMVETLVKPEQTALSDPFMRLRAYLTRETRNAKRRNSITTMALMIKAANAAKRDQAIGHLTWRAEPPHPEAFPTLNVRT